MFHIIKQLATAFPAQHFGLYFLASAFVPFFHLESNETVFSSMLIVSKGTFNVSFGDALPVYICLSPIRLSFHVTQHSHTLSGWLSEKYTTFLRVLRYFEYGECVKIKFAVWHSIRRRRRQRQWITCLYYMVNHVTIRRK